MNILHAKQKPFSLLLILLAAAPPATAQTAASDSLGRKDQQVAEVVVTGTRHATDVRHLSQTVSIVGRDLIEQSQQPALLPVLSEQVPGLFATSRGIMGYGVSGGSAGNISLRGLSGGNARMMVLIDGHPQYAGIFGHPISDACQSLLADRVEVLRGPASVLYGSNAMGGVINIVTRQPHADGVRTQLRGGYGSYNTVETELTNTVRRRRFLSVASASYNRTDGHKAFSRTDGYSARSPFEQFSGYGRIACSLFGHWVLNADLDITHFNAATPGPSSAPLADASQRITRGTGSLALTRRIGAHSSALSFFYNWGKHYVNDGFAPSRGQTEQPGRFRSTDNMLGISAYESRSFFAGNRVTVGFDWFRYGGAAHTDYVSGPDAGTRTDLVDKHQDELAAYIDARQDIGKRLTLNAGLRFDHHSALDAEWVPQAGLVVRLPRAMELRASASKGFRYPILREMYMFPPQNPDLKPESVWNYELAFSGHAGSRLSYGVNVFFLDGKNLIQTLPNPSGAGMLNQNTGHIRNAGVELQVSCRISASWSADGNYSYLHKKHPVTAAPAHQLYAAVRYARSRWTVTSGIQYVSGLYTSVSPDTREAFLLWNLRGSCRVSRLLEVWARGENLLARRYEINAGYPMPRATFMAGLSLNF